MQDQEKLFIEVLTTLNDAGVLQDLIIIGGWCPILYRYHFHDPPEIPALRTADIDFLIPNPPRIHKKVDVSSLLTQLDFDLLTDYISGYTKYSHPDLDIEFVTPELGKGRSAPYEIPQLNVNAQGLRYLNLLQHNVIEISYHNIIVKVPEPTAFVLHKFIVRQERVDTEKRDKDIKIAQEIGEFLVRDMEQRQILGKVFDGLPPKWQQKLKKILIGSDATTLVTILLPQL